MDDDMVKWMRRLIEAEVKRQHPAERKGELLLVVDTVALDCGEIARRVVDAVRAYMTVT